jgi:hypothetical protein
MAAFDLLSSLLMLAIQKQQTLPPKDENFPRPIKSQYVAPQIFELGI